MTTTQTSSNTTTAQVKAPPMAGKAVTGNPDKKPTVAAKGKPSVADTKVSELPVAYQIAPLTKKKKNDKKKVIRDSFSFPEHDHHKITELKKICLAAGVHVKKGEILRAGLGLLAELKLSELLHAVGKVERVRTGRPKSEKS